MLFENSVNSAGNEDNSSMKKISKESRQFIAGRNCFLFLFPGNDHAFAVILVLNITFDSFFAHIADTANIVAWCP